jgi:hypothetical protein
MRKNERHRLAGSLAAAALVLAFSNFWNAAPMAAQSVGGGYTLTWSGASGGAGSSSGGSFGVSGTAGQPQTEQLQGGSYGLTGGFEQPACSSGAAQAVEVTMELERNDADVTLSWTHQTANGAYEVHRSTTPFFTPGSTTLLKTVFAPASSYIDESAAGNPDENHFYLVRARCGALWGDSGRTGEFSYRLAPGN